MSDNYTLVVVTRYPSQESKAETIIEIDAPLEIVTAALHEFTKWPRLGVETIEVKRA